MPDYRLSVTFTNGERRVFDARPLLGVKAFKPLNTPSFFNLVHVDFGTIAWPNGIDYCPDTLYAQSVPV